MYKAVLLNGEPSKKLTHKKVKTQDILNRSRLSKLEHIDDGEHCTHTFYHRVVYLRTFPHIIKLSRSGIRFAETRELT